MTRRLGLSIAAVILVACAAIPETNAQGAPAPAPAGDVPTTVPYEILSIQVEGAADEGSATLARQISGLQVGKKVQLPWDPSFAEAVRSLYRNGGYSDAQIIAEELAGQGVFLTIKVREEPKLASYDIDGLKSGEKDDVRESIPLLRGRAVRPADIERGRLAIQDFLRKKGFRQATVGTAQSVNADGRMELTYQVVRGERAIVSDVRFMGNDAFGESTLRRQLKNTPEKRWWRFWKRETFDDEGFQEDLTRLVTFYNDRGYFGARVTRDSVFFEQTPDGSEQLVVEVGVDEGPKYHVRNVTFEGNTLFTDPQLEFALGVQPGDVYNKTLIERNMYYTEAKTDISSLYNDRGYLRFDIRPQIVEVPGDSLDLSFEITEGDVYEFGQVAIAGNTRTKEHVIRRELRTIPGQPYSRQAIERSVRELSQLNYFDPSSFANGPGVRVDDETKMVDLTYSLAETSSDQLELSGGWGGGGTGLILTARVTFSNFSIQNLMRGEGAPLPSGDGQQLSLQVQTYGSRSQVYSMSFTEPWFRGKQTPAGFSLGYSNYRYINSDARVARGFGRVFYRQRLKWPDDFFITGSNLGFQLYNITGLSGTTIGGLPEGISRELTFQQSLTRSATDNPQLPSAGSNVALSLTVAPPIGDFIQYHKWDLQNDWYTPIGPKLSASIRTRFGYIGSLNGDDVQFQRFLIGGTPLEGNQGVIQGFGKDLVFMRGYPLQAVGPRLNGEPVGGRILNHYQSEISWRALQTPQLTFAPYLFLDAGNTWDSFNDYDPARLYRSAGFGSRVFLPILGLVDLSYGYQIDDFEPLSNDTGTSRWRFQLSLGGG